MSKVKVSRARHVVPAQLSSICTSLQNKCWARGSFQLSTPYGLSPLNLEIVKLSVCIKALAGVLSHIQ